MTKIWYFFDKLRNRNRILTPLLVAQTLFVETRLSLYMCLHGLYVMNIKQRELQGCWKANSRVVWGFFLPGFETINHL